MPTPTELQAEELERMRGELRRMQTTDPQSTAGVEGMGGAVDKQGVYHFGFRNPAARQPGDQDVGQWSWHDGAGKYTQQVQRGSYAAHYDRDGNLVAVNDMPVGKMDADTAESYLQLLEYDEQQQRTVKPLIGPTMAGGLGASEAVLNTMRRYGQGTSRLPESYDHGDLGMEETHYERIQHMRRVKELAEEYAKSRGEIPDDLHMDYEGLPHWDQPRTADGDVVAPGEEYRFDELYDQHTDVLVKWNGEPVLDEGAPLEPRRSKPVPAGDTYIPDYYDD